MGSNSSEEPFLIRSHHLVNFAELAEDVGFGSAPSVSRDDQLADFVRDNVDRLADKSRGEVKEGEKYTDRGALYAIDIVGKNGLSRGSVVQGECGYFDEFLNLPDNYPVRIQSSVRDGLCAACHGGDHCKAITPRENEHLYQLRAWAKAANIPMSDTVVVNDSQPPMFKNRALNTTAGELKAVLQYVTGQRDPVEKNVRMEILWKKIPGLLPGEE